VFRPAVFFWLIVKIETFIDDVGFNMLFIEIISSSDESLTTHAEKCANFYLYPFRLSLFLSFSDTHEGMHIVVSIA
jgi:hypothetical protein